MMINAFIKRVLKKRSSSKKSTASSSSFRGIFGTKSNDSSTSSSKESPITGTIITTTTVTEVTTLKDDSDTNHNLNAENVVPNTTVNETTSDFEPTTTLTTVAAAAEEEETTAAPSSPSSIELAIQAEEKEGVPVDTNLEEEVLPTALLFYKCLSDHDLEGAEQYISEDLVYEFYDINEELNAELPWKVLREEMAKVFKSFPDFNLAPQMNVVKEEEEEDQDQQYKDNNGNNIIVQRIRGVASGTHTGEPYTFGPCEPIQATGKRVVSDPEHVYCYLNNHHDHQKIYKVKVYAQGEMTGPAGFYTLLGGFPLLQYKQQTNKQQSTRLLPVSLFPEFIPQICKPYIQLPSL